jgi:hypothetical protein
LITDFDIVVPMCITFFFGILLGVVLRMEYGE